MGINVIASNLNPVIRKQIELQFQDMYKRRTKVNPDEDMCKCHKCKEYFHKDDMIKRLRIYYCRECDRKIKRRIK